MNELIDFVPFLIPVILIQLGLLIYALHHVLTHDKYKFGNRVMWIIIVLVFMNFLGPILYLIIGKDE